MPTKLEILYNIKELMREHTDDTLMSDRHILFLFGMHRAKLLRQLYSDRAKELDSSALQTLCVGMETVDKGLCGITVNCNIKRSKVKVPDLLSLKGRSALVSAGPPMVGSNKFDLINNVNVNAVMADEYATTSVFFEDDYLYVIGPVPAAELVSCIRITGIFDSPMELENFSSTCPTQKFTPCVTDDTEYPIPGHMIADVTQLVLKDFLTTLNVVQIRDIENDSTPAVHRGK